MRFAGRIAPGSGVGAVFTGHRLEYSTLSRISRRRRSESALMAGATGAVARLVRVLFGFVGAVDLPELDPEESRRVELLRTESCASDELAASARMSNGAASERLLI